MAKALLSTSKRLLCKVKQFFYPWVDLTNFYSSVSGIFHPLDRLIISLELVPILKGTLSQELRHRLLYIIRKLFSMPIAALLQILILLKGQFAMYMKQFSVS